MGTAIRAWVHRAPEGPGGLGGAGSGMSPAGSGGAGRRGARRTITVLAGSRVPNEIGLSHRRASWYWLPVTSTEADLVRVVVWTPERRMDVAIPGGVPLAALLPVLLRNGGTDLAGTGLAHGGWVLRRLDGEPLDPAADVAALGIRHGDELRLGLADEIWPEFDYDDIPAAIADDSTGRRRLWDARAGRVAAIAASAVLLGAGLAAVLLAGPPWPASTAVAAVVAAVLLAAGIVAIRAYRDTSVGTALAALALPYAFVAALLAAGRPGAHTPLVRVIGPGSVSLAGAVVVVVAIAAAAGLGRRPSVLVAAAVIGLGTVLAAVVAASGVSTDTAEAGAATALGALVLLSGLAPSVATRLGGLPRPDPSEGALPGPVDLDTLRAAMRRADDVLTGLLLGVSAAAAGASAVLVAGGGWAAQTLVAVAAIGLALRARAFPALRHRAVALSGAGLAGAALAASLVGHGLLVAAALAVLALVILGTANARPSPYLGRAGDLLEVACLAAVVPLVCAVLGLYGRIRGLHL
jgi:type VII secretion integral membrane protein EccD